MTIKFKNGRVHWRSTKVFIQKPGLFGKILAGHKDIRIPFQMIPERKNTNIPSDEVRYISVEGQPTIVKGPEINDDSFCREADIKWFPSNLEQIKFVSGSKERH